MRPAEPVAGAGGLLLLVSLYLPWYGLELPAGTGNLAAPVLAAELAGATASGWQAFTVTDILLALLALPAIAVPIVSLTARGPAKPIAVEVIASAVGWIAVVLVAYRLIDPPGPNAFIALRYGAWLALAGALIAWVGSWLAMSDESTPGAVAPDVPRRPAPPPAA